jgi:hypothetical protein
MNNANWLFLTIYFCLDFGMTLANCAILSHSILFIFWHTLCGKVGFLSGMIFADNKQD